MHKEIALSIGKFPRIAISSTCLAKGRDLKDSLSDINTLPSGKGVVEHARSIVCASLNTPIVEFMLHDNASKDGAYEYGCFGEELVHGPTVGDLMAAHLQRSQVRQLG